MHTVMRRTELTRRQLRYLEDRQLIGFVERLNGRRAYGPDQVELLERLSRLRQIGVSLDEAAVIAGASVGSPAIITVGRLTELLRRSQREAQLRARTASDLCELLEKQLAALGAPGAA